MEEGKVNFYGMDGLDLLQVAFIILKVTKIINWNWAKVFIPLYIQLGVFVVAIVVATIVFFIMNKE